MSIIVYPSGTQITNSLYYEDSGTNQTEVFSVYCNGTEVWKKIRNVTSSSGSSSGNKVITITNGADFDISIPTNVALGTVTRYNEQKTETNNVNLYKGTSNWPYYYGTYNTASIEKIDRIEFVSETNIKYENAVITGDNSYTIELQVDDSSMSSAYAEWIIYGTTSSTQYQTYLETATVGTTIYQGTSRTYNLVDSNNMRVLSTDTWSWSPYSNFNCSARYNDGVCVNSPYNMF